jgi:hypothetical protein
MRHHGDASFIDSRALRNTAIVMAPEKAITGEVRI